MTNLKLNLENSVSLKKACAENEVFLKEFENLCQVVAAAYEKGGRLYVCGNGGSAADAQHIVAEFVSKLCRDRAPMAAEALTVDTSILTAIGNDYGFDKLFERQVLGKMTPKDVLLGITTSGNSENICRAITAANAIGASSVAFSGRSGGLIKELCPNTVVVPSENTAAIQEIHIVLGHTLCEYVEQKIIFDKE